MGSSGYKSNTKLDFSNRFTNTKLVRSGVNAAVATYVNNLRVAEPADGDADWGTTTNTSLELIGEALGIGSEAISNQRRHSH